MPTFTSSRSAGAAGVFGSAAGAAARSAERAACCWAEAVSLGVAVALGAAAAEGTANADGTSAGADGVVPGRASPTWTAASPPENFRPSGCAFGATEPSAVSTRVVSTGTHASPTFMRTGPPATSWVSVPSGLAHSVVLAVRAPVTSIRRLLSRAASSADASSGASLTGEATGGLVSATATAGLSAPRATPVSTTSPSAASTAIRRTLRTEKAPPAYACEAWELRIKTTPQDQIKDT
ncbi:hypothetical protein GCM10020229_23300 [Kitasatospora albolonga]